jgi:heme/copper-type cytochrome/quinol oxidase subunit 1
MAMTGERETAAAAAPSAEGATAARPVGGLAGLLGNTDHKVVGRLYIGAALLLLAVAGVTGGLVSAERLDAGTFDVLDSGSLAQVFSLHSVSAVFLFLLPLMLGLAIVVTPLQVGASTIAFPRAAAASFWLWFLSSAVVLAAYAIDGGAFGGDYDGVSLFLVGFASLLVALCLATVCVVTTVLTLRTRGMTLERAPLFSWSMVVAGVVWLVTLPVLFGLVVLSYLSYRYQVGGSEEIYDYVRWTFQQPQVWAFAVPALGIVAEVVPVFTRQVHRSHAAVMVLVGVGGAMGIGSWAFLRSLQPDATSLEEQALYIAMAFAVALPVLGLLGASLDAIARSRKVPVASPLVFSLVGLLVLVLAAGAGAIGAVGALDLQFLGGQDTTWSTGVAHAVLGGATIVVLGGLHYWAPKLWGTVLREGVARLAALLVLVGGTLLVGGDLIAGALDQLTGGALQDVRDNVEMLNLVSFAGGLVLAGGLVVAVLNLLGALVRRVEVADDPWEGNTLEWACSSPPPAGNFAEPVEVASATPLLDLRTAGKEQSG